MVVNKKQPLVVEVETREKGNGVRDLLPVCLMARDALDLGAFYRPPCLLE